jgi:glycosyltransferase involved in cell wall biosynthesis
MINFCIDSPVSWNFEGSNFYISGWVFGDKKILAIRACTSKMIFYTKYELLRPDVASVYLENAFAAKSGFEIQGGVDFPGENVIFIEAQLEDGSWHQFFSQIGIFSFQELLLALDTPMVDGSIEGRINFSGWCFHRSSQINKMTLIVNDMAVDVDYGHRRVDVHDAYPQYSFSEKSGFSVDLNLKPGVYDAKFIIDIINGVSIEYLAPHQILVKKRPLKEKFSSVVIRLFQLHQSSFYFYSYTRFKKWFSKNRRIPKISELIPLYSKARFEYAHLMENLHGQLLPPIGFSLPIKADFYQSWLEVNGNQSKLSENLHIRLRNYEGVLPKISIVMPIYNPPKKYFDLAVSSVKNQVYENWELCITDDASTEKWVHSYLDELVKADSRIKVIYSKTNENISAATNKAASLSEGSFLAFLDQDDQLSPDALGEAALFLAKNNDIDILYSDDDKIDEDGVRYSPQFKPDWSPELLLSYMYLSHLLVIRRSLYELLGGVRIGFEGSQDYDLVLRASEVTQKVAHLPYVLYHWRALPGSTALGGGEKPDSFIAGQKAIHETFMRRGIEASVFRPQWARSGGLGIYSHDFPDDGPSVAIIIPTKNQKDILKRCIDSIAKTSYKNYEIVIIDNESDDKRTLEYLASLNAKILKIGNPNNSFNYAYINNRAVELVDADFILFLNNDTEVITPKWLSNMVGYGEIQGVGAVGARLFYPDERLQHAGIVHGYYGGIAGPAFKLMPAWNNGYLSYARVLRNFSAVTAACLLTRRDVFIDVGGFDESSFAVAYNDVDYCYRLTDDKGLRVAYCASAELFHHEGFSRGYDDNPAELAAFKYKYFDKADTFYSPNLSLKNEFFEVERIKIPRSEITKPITSLMCAFNLNLEGAPYSQYEMTLELYKLGVIKPIVFSPADGPLRKLYEKEGIRVEVRPHPLEGVFSEDEYLLRIQDFANWLQQESIEILYANTLQTFYAIDAAKRANIQSLWNVRESEPWQTYFNYLPTPVAIKALECFKSPYKIIFVAHATRIGFEALNSNNNFCVINNGLNECRLQVENFKSSRDVARQALGLESNEIMVLLLGTVCERKGQKDLVTAIKYIEPHLMSQIKIFIVGDRSGAYSNELKKMISDLPNEIKGNAILIPETDETGVYYSAADIFVCTSRIESYPRVILEAMSFGLPIISTPVFGIVEQMKHGVNGEFYKPGNAAQLAEKLAKLSQDFKLREYYSVNSKEILKTLTSFDQMIKGYKKLFLEASEV